MIFPLIIGLIMGIAGGSILGATQQQKADKMHHMRTVKTVFTDNTQK